MERFMEAIKVVVKAYVGAKVVKGIFKAGEMKQFIKDAWILMPDTSDDEGGEEFNKLMMENILKHLVKKGKISKEAAEEFRKNGYERPED